MSKEETDYFTLLSLAAIMGTPTHNWSDVFEMAQPVIKWHHHILAPSSKVYFLPPRYLQFRALRAELDFAFCKIFYLRVDLQEKKFPYLFKCHRLCTNYQYCPIWFLWPGQRRQTFNEDKMIVKHNWIKILPSRPPLRRLVAGVKLDLSLQSPY